MSSFRFLGLNSCRFLRGVCIARQEQHVGCWVSGNTRRDTLRKKPPERRETIGASSGGSLDQLLRVNCCKQAITLTTGGEEWRERRIGVMNVLATDRT